MTTSVGPETAIRLKPQYEAAILKALDKNHDQKIGTDEYTPGKDMPPIASPTKGSYTKGAYFKLRKINEEEYRVVLDLSHTDLSTADLRGADLRNADLSFANLSDAKLGGADLRGAKIFRANLDRTDFSGTEENPTKMSGVSIMDCKGKNTRFNHVDLSRAIISGATLNYPSFIDSDISAAVFEPTTQMKNPIFRNVQSNHTMGNLPIEVRNQNTREAFFFKPLKYILEKLGIL